MTPPTEHSMTAESTSSDHVHEHSGDGQTGLLLKVFGALCVLTAVSFAIANSPLMNSRVVGWTLMLSVSCAKAFLVIAYFMHLRWERTWKYALTLPSLAMAVLLVVALIPDIAQRSGRYSESRWRHATEGALAVGALESAAAIDSSPGGDSAVQFGESGEVEN